MRDTSKRQHWTRQQQQFTICQKLSEDVHRDLKDIKARIDLCAQTKKDCAVDLKDYEALTEMINCMDTFKQCMKHYREGAQEKLDLMMK